MVNQLGKKIQTLLNLRSKPEQERGLIWASAKPLPCGAADAARAPCGRAAGWVLGRPPHRAASEGPARQKELVLRSRVRWAAATARGTLGSEALNG